MIRLSTLLFCLSFITKLTCVGDRSANMIKLEGDIKQNLVLKNTGVPYILSGYVRVLPPYTLTIEKGVEIQGDFNLKNGKPATLIIERGAKILAEGTATEPIIFTSSKLAGERQSGDWGGIVIIGNAPVNAPQGSQSNDDPDITPKGYGGNKPEDNSGILKYVVVHFAGYRFVDDVQRKQHNAFSFYGVGNGTVVDYIHAHKSGDDGIELFGGTVDIRHAVSSHNKDDQFDWTEGWTGRGQYWIGLQCGQEGDNGIEGDNCSENQQDPNALPRSKPMLYNITLVGDAENPNAGNGVFLGTGSGLVMANSLVLDYCQRSPLDITGKHCGKLLGKEIIIHYCLFDNEKKQTNFAIDKDRYFDEPKYIFSDSLRLFNQENPDYQPLINPFSCNSPDFRAALDRPLVSKTDTFIYLPNKDFFNKERSDMIGAMDNDTDWSLGWVNYYRD